MKALAENGAYLFSGINRQVFRCSAYWRHGYGLIYIICLIIYGYYTICIPVKDWRNDVFDRLKFIKPRPLPWFAAYDLHTDNGGRGDEFMDMIEPIASRIPYMTAPGNHERRNLYNQYRRRCVTASTSTSSFHSCGDSSLCITSHHHGESWQ